MTMITDDLLSDLDAATLRFAILDRAGCTIRAARGSWSGLRS
jgi:hypothetical protein